MNSELGIFGHHLAYVDVSTLRVREIARGGGASHPLGKSVRKKCGGGAIFNIVGPTDIRVGRMPRANNVEGGSSREARTERQRTVEAPLKAQPHHNRVVITGAA